MGGGGGGGGNQCNGPIRKSPKLSNQPRLSFQVIIHRFRLFSSSCSCLYDCKQAH